MSATAHRSVEAVATGDADHSIRTGFEASLSSRYTADPASYATYGHLFWWEAPDRAVQLLREHARSG